MDAVLGVIGRQLLVGIAVSSEPVAAALREKSIIKAIANTDRSTVSQSDKMSSSNGKGRLTGDGAGGCDDSEATHAIPILSDKVVNVASVPQRSLCATRAADLART